MLDWLRRKLGFQKQQQAKVAVAGPITTRLQQKISGGWTHVASSNLEAVKYDPDRQHLYIRFKEGREYRYSGVSKGIYQALLSAPSHGKFFHFAIKGQYPFQRLS